MEDEESGRTTHSGACLLAHETFSLWLLLVLLFLSPGKEMDERYLAQPYPWRPPEEYNSVTGVIFLEKRIEDSFRSVMNISAVWKKRKWYCCETKVVSFPLETGRESFVFREDGFASTDVTVNTWQRASPASVLARPSLLPLPVNNGIEANSSRKTLSSFLFWKQEWNLGGYGISNFQHRETVWRYHYSLSMSSTVNSLLLVLFCPARLLRYLARLFRRWRQLGRSEIAESCTYLLKVFGAIHKWTL